MALNRVVPCEFKLTGDDLSFSGYGSVYGNIDSHGDIVANDAFKTTLAEIESSGDWPELLLQHGGTSVEEQMPIGVWTALRSDTHGLYVEGKLADTQRGRDVYTLMKMSPRPALKGLSIGYRARRWLNHGRADKARRTLLDVSLSEISVVTRPSNPLSVVQQVKHQRGADAAKQFSDALERLAAALRQ